MLRTSRLISWLILATTYLSSSTNAAPTDSTQDADIAQSSYLGTTHNLSPSSLSNFTNLWNHSFPPEEKHFARPLIHTLPSTNRQIVFTASTTNRVRTFDAITGELLAEREILPPWPMDATNCSVWGKTMGIVGTPVIYTAYEDGIAFFYVKSYIEDYRQPGGSTPVLNAVYYLYGIYLTTLADLYKFPLIIDDVPHDNDARKIFLGGLVVQESALTLVGDVLYAGFGGMCGKLNYTGAVVAVDLASRNVWRWATQAGSESRYTDDWAVIGGGGQGGVGMGGMGVASDGRDVWFTVEEGGGAMNGSVAMSGKTHIDVLSRSVARITLDEEGGKGVQLLDWFRPHDAEAEDLGDSAFAVLDDAFKTADGKRIGVSVGKNKLYVQDLDNLGGYRQGRNGSNGVLQTIEIDSIVSGGIGSYPLEGGYIYVNPENGPLRAYAFASNASQPFTLAGKSTTSHGRGVGIPTITSQDKPDSGIVWITDVERGLLAYYAIPVNGTLIEIPLPKVNGALKSSRPIFGDGRVYMIDANGTLVALGAR